MGQTTSGLPNGGLTAHYEISYDQSFPGTLGRDVATAVCQTCEADFNLIARWFSGVGIQYSFPIVVYINNAGGGASWHGPPAADRIFGGQPTVQINAGNPLTANLVRFLLVMEVTEIFMASQNAGWWHGADFFHNGVEGDKGEGLSRFLGFQFLKTIGQPENAFPDYQLVPGWLNSTRPNHIDDDLADHDADVVNGCTSAFIHYLHYQLGFSEQRIIGAAEATLGGVYTKLTGVSNGSGTFLAFVNARYPVTPGFQYTLLSDRLFPAPNLYHLYDVTILAGESQAVTLLSLDAAAPADIAITFSADHPEWLRLPPLAHFTPGQQSLDVVLTATGLTGPARSTRIHATYAGRTLSATVTIAPRPSVIRGRVTDESGQPIADASVMIEADIEIVPGFGGTLQLSTDAGGYYETPAIPPHSYGVRASQSGYAESPVVTVVVALGVPEVDRNFVLAVSQPIVIIGSLADMGGVAIAGGKVEIETNVAGIPASASALSGTFGDYLLSFDHGSYAGDYTIQATADGFRAQSEIVTLANGGFLTRNYRLERLGAIAGAVRAPSGAPVINALVRAGGQSAWSGVDGRYAIGGLDPVATGLTVTAAGFDVFTEILFVPAGGVAQADVTLRPATAVITGTVTDTVTGGPVAKALVSTGQGHVSTGANGVFTLTQVPAGVATLRISAKGYAAHAVSTPVSDGQTVTLRLSLTPLRKPGPPGSRPPLPQ